MNLRREVVKLAYQSRELRNDLLPLVRKAQIIEEPTAGEIGTLLKRLNITEKARKIVDADMSELTGKTVRGKLLDSTIHPWVEKPESFPKSRKYAANWEFRLEYDARDFPPYEEFGQLRSPWVQKHSKKIGRYYDKILREFEKLCPPGTLVSKQFWPGLELRGGGKKLIYIGGAIFSGAIRFN